MERVADAATIRHLPRPLTLEQHIALKTFERTGLIPFSFQVAFAIGIDSGRDVVCVAGTGRGKSLAFAIIHFFRDDVITWIVSPLNVIENQMAKSYEDYGLSAVAVNASTITPTLIEDIKRGKYQVIISSPESYKDMNKLRQALLSPELAHKRHVTIVDEAHCIATWGGRGFRKDFERIGDMRVFMPDPDNSPMCAATATLSTKVKDAVIRSLHIKPNHVSINLGNWRSNLCYGLHIMRGGQLSYSEVCDFFTPRPDRLEDTPQTLIFVESYTAAHAIALELRQHFGLSGEDAADQIPVYHSMIDDPTKHRIERRFKSGKSRIMVTTEALTMGADFPNVQLVINFLAPDLLEIWVQRAGRGARTPDILCRCIIMVTKRMVLNAANQCKDAGIEVDPVVLAMKVEDGEELVGDLEDPPEAQMHRADQGPHGSCLGMAEYIAIGSSSGCLSGVIDRFFDNPPHTSCYDVGGCEDCVKRRRNDECDIHQEERHEHSHGQQDSLDISEEELKHKVPQRKPEVRVGAERARFVDGLKSWRQAKLQEVLDEYDIDIDSIMTKKELERIAKIRGISEPSDFDKPEVSWPGEHDWRVELLGVLSDLQRIEDDLVAEAEEKARIKAEAAEQAREERKRKAEEAAREREERKEARERKAAETAARKALQLVPTGLAIDPVVQPGASSSFGSFSVQTPDQLPRARAIGTMHIHIGPDGLPSPITPSTALPPIPWSAHIQQTASSSSHTANTNINNFNTTSHVMPSPLSQPPVPPTPSRRPRRQPQGPRPRPGEFRWVMEDPSGKSG